jgi:hypothetical protein
VRPNHLKAVWREEAARELSGQLNAQMAPSSVVWLKLRLQEESKKPSELQKQCEPLQDHRRMGEVRVKWMVEDLPSLQREVFM